MTGLHNSPLPSALSVSAAAYQLPSEAEGQGNPLQISSPYAAVPKTQADTVETKHGSAHPLPEAGKTAGKIRIDRQNAYSASRPALVGAQLLTHIETLRRQFGKPLQEYVMNNGKDSMTVLDYGDFFSRLQSVRAAAVYYYKLIRHRPRIKRPAPRRNDAGRGPSVGHPRHEYQIRADLQITGNDPQAGRRSGHPNHPSHYVVLNLLKKPEKPRGFRGFLFWGSPKFLL